MLGSTAVPAALAVATAGGTEGFALLGGMPADGVDPIELIDPIEPPPQALNPNAASKLMNCRIVPP
jgi:hypothetical protein